MRNSTTIRVGSRTRDELRRLASRDNLTLDQMIEQLIRAERQRRMGQELSEAVLDDADAQWLDFAGEVIRTDDAGG